MNGSRANGSIARCAVSRVETKTAPGARLPPRHNAHRNRRRYRHRHEPAGWTRNEAAAAAINIGSTNAGFSRRRLRRNQYPAATSFIGSAKGVTFFARGEREADHFVDGQRFTMQARCDGLADPVTDIPQSPRAFGRRATES